MEQTTHLLAPYVRAKVGSYVSDRAAGPLTTEAIHKRHSDLSEQTIDAALSDLYGSGTIRAMHFPHAMARYRRRIEKFNEALELFSNPETQQNITQQRAEAERKLTRLEFLSGRYARKPSIDRPPTLVEFIASHGGLFIPRQAKPGKKKIIVPDSQLSLSLLGGPQTLSARQARADRATEVKNILAGYPTFTWPFGHVASSNGRLTVADAAESSHQAGFYMREDGVGNGTNSDAFLGLLETDLAARQNRNWSRRVFSSGDQAEAYDFIGRLKQQRGDEKYIENFGMPSPYFSGEVSPAWRRHVKQLKGELLDGQFTRNHLLLCAHHLGFDPEAAAVMDDDDLAVEVETAHGMNNDNRPLRDIAKGLLGLKTRTAVTEPMPFK